MKTRDYVSAGTRKRRSKKGDVSGRSTATHIWHDLEPNMQVDKKIGYIRSRYVHLNAVIT